MAQPQKKERAKLTAVLPPIRCTESEKALLQEQAKQRGITLSQHIRSLPEIAEKHGGNARPAVNPELVFQLRSIGNNLNQAVRKFHIRDEMPEVLRECSATLTVLLTEIYRQVKK